MLPVILELLLLGLQNLACTSFSGTSDHMLETPLLLHHDILSLIP